MTGVYQIAGHRIGIESMYPDVHRFCSAYRTSGEPEITIRVPAEELEASREAVEEKIRSGAILPFDCSMQYLEVAWIYKKLSERMPYWDIFMLHGSAVAVDGECYAFCAKSGTGKSTHSRLWREMLGDRAVMVNDDKPMIRVREDGGADVYGTPWDGKHKLSTNTHVPLKAICFLERSSENSIREISKSEAYPSLLQSVYRPFDPEAMEKTLQLIERMNVKFYRLWCNMDISAAELSYQTMKG